MCKQWESRGVDQTAAVKPSNGSRRQTRLEVPTKNSAYDNVLVLSSCLVTHQGSTCIQNPDFTPEYSFTAETDLAHSFLFGVAQSLHVMVLRQDQPQTCSDGRSQVVPDDWARLWTWLEFARKPDRRPTTFSGQDP